MGPPDSIPNTLDLTNPTQVSSGVSHDEFEKVNRENNKLAREVKDLQNQVKELLTRSSPSPQLPEHHLSQIIAAVKAAMQLEQQAQNTTTHSPHTEDDNVLNMSFDQHDQNE